MEEDDSVIVCYIEDLKFVTIKMSYNGISTVAFTINTVNDSYINWKNGNAYIYYAFKTSYGISFTLNTSTLRSIFTICKDNNGNTTAIFARNLTVDKSGSSSYIHTANPKTAVITNAEFRVLDNKLGITAAVPLFVGDTENYTPDVMLLAYAQNVSDGIIDINGIRYYSNGLWCLKI